MGLSNVGSQGHRGSCLNSETLFPNCERIAVWREFPELLPRQTGLRPLLSRPGQGCGGAGPPGGVQVNGAGVCPDLNVCPGGWH